MKYTSISLSQLAKWTDIPKVLNDLADETWFVAVDDQPIGVGLFKENSDTCIMAIVGESDDDQKIIGHSSSDTDADEATVQDALKLAFVTYLRSIKGDKI